MADKSEELTGWQQNLSNFFRAMLPCLFIETLEEERAFQQLVGVAQYLGVTKCGCRNILVWSNASLQQHQLWAKKGEAVTECKPQTIEYRELFAALTAFAKPDQTEPVVHAANILVLADAADALNSATNVRFLKETIRAIRGTRKTIVLLGKHFNLPAEVQNEVTVVPFELPQQTELKATVNYVLNSYRSTKGYEHVGIEDTQVDPFCRACAGITEHEMRNVLSLAVAKHKAFDARAVSSALVEKSRIVQRSKVLEVITPKCNLSQVGGLENVKAWVEETTPILQRPDAAHEYGLKLPSGLLLLGVSGCLRGDTVIFDPVDNTRKTVAERCIEAKPFNVISRCGGEAIIADADAPKKFDAEEMVTFTLDSGKEISVTLGHKFWNGVEYVEAYGVLKQLQEYGVYRLPSISDTCLSALMPDVRRLTKTSADYRGDYPRDYYLYDALLRSAEVTGQELAPSQDGARGYIRDDCNKDGLVEKAECSLTYQLLCRHAKLGLTGLRFCFAFLRQLFEAVRQYGLSCCREFSQCPAGLLRLLNTYRLLVQCVPASTCGGSGMSEGCGVVGKPVMKIGQKCGQSVDEYCLPDINAESLLCHVVSLVQSPSKSGVRYTGVRTIVKAELCGKHEYYDFHVPLYNNYWAQDVFHHNTGKSLTAEALAAHWQLPLLNFDVGRAFGGILGETESNIREVIRVAEATAPVVILLDEIEKGLGGDSMDGGTSQRILATLLRWLETKPEGVFVVATANDIRALGKRPELLQRFSDSFFVDLPDMRSRIEILSIHLAPKHSIPADDLVDVAKAVKGYSGREIRNVVRKGLAAAFKSGAKHPSREHMLAAAKLIVPTSQTLREQIAELRKWCLDGRAIPAGATLEADSKDEQSFKTDGLPDLGA